MSTEHDEALDTLEALGESAPLPRGGEIQCLTIIGQVEGHQLLPENVKTTKYEHVMPLLAAVEESADIRALLVLVNTVGGDIEAGMGIAELIAGMGQAHGLPGPGGQPLHRRASGSGGGPEFHRPQRRHDHPPGAAHRRGHRRAPRPGTTLPRSRSASSASSPPHSRISRAQFEDYMLRSGELMGDVGSVIYGEEAVRCGLIHQVGGLRDALDYLHGRLQEEKQ